MNKAIQGYLGATFIGRREGRNPDTGVYFEDIWEGPSRDAVTGIIAEFGGNEYYIEPMGTKWRAVIRTSNPPEGDAETPVDSVRLVANRLSQSLYSCPEFLEADPADVRKVQEWEQNPNPSAAPALTDPKAQVLFLLIFRRVSSKVIYAPMLVRTKTASNTYRFVINYSRVGSIILPNRIASEAELTNIDRFNLPQNSSTIPGYQFGWLKHYPEVDRVAGGRLQLVQEFEWNLWSTDLYPVVA